MSRNVHNLSTRERIIRSLFSERAEDGSPQESYITHVRIYEDPQNPSAPPSVPTPLEDRKERYILLTVKKNGRVRLHKSRQNDNGTFQIGKTWNLDDVKHFENIDDRGMVVTLLKPYYWQMDTKEEKLGFVSAVMRVYRKYTGGRMFTLEGFSENFLANAESTLSPAPTSSQPAGRTVSAQPHRAPPQQQQPGQANAPRRVSDMGGVELRRPAPGQTQQRIPGTPEMPGMPAAPPARSPFRRPSENTPMSGVPATPSSAYEVPRRAGSTLMSPPIQPDYPRQQQQQRPLSIETDLRSPPIISNQRQVSSPLGGAPRSVTGLQKSDMPPPLRKASTGSAQLASPLPSKSPARRPSAALRTTSMEQARSAYTGDRYSQGDAHSLLGRETPPPVPLLPSKSVARSGASSPAISMQTRDEKRELPWDASGQNTPREEKNLVGLGLERPGSAVSQSPSYSTTTSAATLTAGASLNKATGRLTPFGLSQDRQHAESLDVYPDDPETAFIDELLRGFQWNSSDGTAPLERRLEDELAAMENTNVLTMVQQDDRVTDLMGRLDQAISQCDEMANMLTIYEFELGSAADHIRHIEGQSAGLQIETANQKALIAEIDNVLSSITISSDNLDSLGSARLDDKQDITKLEKSLANLFRALKAMNGEQRNGRGMSALQSKETEYDAKSKQFVLRLCKYLQIKFPAAMMGDKRRKLGPGEAPPRLLPGHEAGYEALFTYAGFMLYAREIDVPRYREIISNYSRAAKDAWKETVVEFALGWKALARRATAEEMDMLFTSAREQLSQFGSMSRAATLKRSNTLAKQIRGQSGPKQQPAPPAQDRQEGKLPAAEVFTIVLDNLALILSTEQNFLVDFFHLTSVETIEFPDYVGLGIKQELTVARLEDHKQMEPDRQLAKQRFDTMDNIFSWLQAEVLALAEQLTKQDAIQVVGMLKAVEVISMEWRGSDQEYMLRLLEKVFDRLAKALNDFMEAQIRAIISFKLTSKKRSGVIPVFEIFPDFVERIEEQLYIDDSVTLKQDDFAVRGLVNQAYERISKAMFESVRTLASSVSSTGASNTTSGGGTISAMTGFGDSSEDKELLNYHILMLENMHLFMQTLRIGSKQVPSLERFQGEASRHFNEHLEAYTRSIVARPLGRVADFCDNVERQAAKSADFSKKASLSPATAKRLVVELDEREMKRAISALAKRVEKHFSGGESAADKEEELLALVWRESGVVFVKTWDRFEQVLGKWYPQLLVSGECRPVGKSYIQSCFAKRDPNSA
ncbi:exocyst complex component Sec3-domain-containing protein [Protomyces lactucae-debilis]|uniref:Exocyst complex component Sec3-domain-containing protein n=1 Tax=Protomyces lactucae-debilis TaxID=2754530 RepID=A0A1Y2FH55_PROLT|nr:exocyst complex component Sec3-domain-containing protein [Protomyces lactucae-debilis]ORY83253.1 exocyst complex component Sec3-domain-containing protein [Protomyces lactucae-debilis]